MPDDSVMEPLIGLHKLATEVLGMGLRLALIDGGYSADEVGVDDLLERGLISPTADEDLGDEKWYRLTDAGKEFVGQVLENYIPERPMRVRSRLIELPTLDDAVSGTSRVARDFQAKTHQMDLIVLGVPHGQGGPVLADIRDKVIPHLVVPDPEKSETSASVEPAEVADTDEPRETTQRAHHFESGTIDFDKPVGHGDVVEIIASARENTWTFAKVVLADSGSWVVREIGGPAEISVEDALRVAAKQIIPSR